MYQPKQLGNTGEAQAVQFLRARGYYIRHRQWHCRWGEIDIVAYDPSSRTLVCVEVKYRRTRDSQDEMISWRQRQRLARAIAAYCQAHDYSGAVRCDLVVVFPEGIDQTPNILLQ